MTAFENQISPVVSIVLPVKNGAQYIGKAIDSILNQTYTNFELIIIDDGSTDETVKIVNQYKDSRLRLISQENQGVAKAANRGFALSKGQYITRHDHDDISLPTRLEKQVQYLETHPECGMVGAWAHIWCADQPTERTHRHPTSPGEIALALIFDAPFVNASCLFRKEVLQWSGGYCENEDRIPPEDYELFSRVSQKFDLANIPEYLMIYREVPNSQSSAIRSSQESKKKIFVSHLALFSAENLALALGHSDPSIDAYNFGSLVHGYFEGLKEPINLNTMKEMLTNATKNLAIRFHEPEILKILKGRLLFLEYQYQTYMGNTLHPSRVKYLFFNRPWHENLGSIGRLLYRMTRKSI